MRIVDIFIVPDSTMRASVVLGRDTLKNFNLGLMALQRQEAGVVREFFQINVLESNIEDSLQINSEMDIEMHSTLKQLFISDYLNKERPEFPKQKTELSLHLSSDSPIFFNPRRLSYEEKMKLQEILDKLIAKNIIRESESHYATPIVLVKEKNGENRFCIDYRFLNKITLPVNYPMPLIEYQLDKLKNKCFYT